jgi:hypothetical protein
LPLFLFIWPLSQANYLHPIRKSRIVTPELTPGVI